jgi:hypothetical protein
MDYRRPPTYRDGVFFNLILNNILVNDLMGTYQWTLGWGLVSQGAAYEIVVDNLAWA